MGSLLIIRLSRLTGWGHCSIVAVPGPLSYRVFSKEVTVQCGGLNFYLRVVWVDVLAILVSLQLHAVCSNRVGNAFGLLNRHVRIDGARSRIISGRIDQLRSNRSCQLFSWI